MSDVALPLALLALTSLGGAALYGPATETIPLASFGVGAFDFRDNNEQDQAVDFRFDYRFGDALVWNLKPFIGLQATSDGGAGAFGGILADFVFADKWVVTPSFGAGLWADGGGKDLGYPIEFRSQLELGYRFDNSWRLTGAVSHISNAELGNDNDGADMLSVYLHIPADSILPR